jgi:parallel beta-helix repeat protein
MFKKLSLLVFFPLVWACSSDEPVKSINAKACFEIATEAKQGTAITFNAACSQNVVTYAWQFGDGSTSTEAAPVHSYIQAGTFQVTLTVTAGNNTTDTFTSNIKITAVPTKFHSMDIKADETWEAGFIHVVSGSLDVFDATVTLQPGITVKFKEDASLNIGTEEGVTKAALLAKGTAQQPIVFTADAASPARGFYYGLRFGPGSNGLSALTYCTIEYAGVDYATTSNGNIQIDGTTVSLENNTIRHSKGAGIYTKGNAFFAKFNNNTISDYETYALELSPNTVHTLGDNNTLGDKPVIIGGSFTLPSATWTKKNFPYLIAGLAIGSASGSVLTIQPGVTFKMLSGMITVGDNSWGPGKGTLIAEGTQSEPIVFTSSKATPAPKDWDGIHFYSGNQGSRLKYCTLEYGGSFGYNYNYIGMLQLAATTVNVSYCTFRHALTCAVYLNYNSSFELFDHNTIDVGTLADGVNMPANATHTLGVNNVITAKRQIVTGGYFTLPSATWPKQPYPYYTDFIAVGSNQNPAWLTLAPGVEIRFSAGGSLQVGQGEYSNGTGGLIAVGTPENPIVLTSANSPAAPGDWSKLEFNSGALAGTIAKYVVVDYAGSTAGYGAVYVDQTNVPTISNCIIRNSKTYGLLTEYCTPTLSANVFSNNAMGDIKNIN